MTAGREALQERRIKGGLLLYEGKPASFVARELGVSRQSVYRWLTMIAEGRSLAATKPTGRPRNVR
jgi:transposase